MRYQKMREKEVVNVLDGKSLGFICDMQLDLATGKVCSLIVPGCMGLRNLFRNNYYVIPWCNILKIGEDIILVEVDMCTCAIEK